jgi:hypothetical protein
LQDGQFAEARAVIKRALESFRPIDVRFAFAQQLQECERFLLFNANLPDILEGKAKPANAVERLGFARCLQYKKLNAAAARFYAEAFAEEPKLADNLRAGHRYAAACAAALAGTGQGKDAGTLEDQERAKLRQQALAWMRSDFEAQSKGAENVPKTRSTVVQNLRAWQSHRDLAAVRAQAELAKLPEAEREDWRRLWADVDILLAKTCGNQ